MKLFFSSLYIIGGIEIFLNFLTSEVFLVLKKFKYGSCVNVWLLVINSWEFFKEGMLGSENKICPILWFLLNFIDVECNLLKFI